MSTICGADCAKCYFMGKCEGCGETCGHPFGGTCIAAEYIRIGGMKAYAEFREKLKEEVNRLLRELELPEAEGLNELPGGYVNLEYTLPGGEKAKFLDERKIYLGTQIEIPDCEICCGVVADTEFILICRYGEGGSDPELLLYKKR